MSGIPYGLVLFMAVCVLATRHVSTSLASTRSKWAVGVLALGSVLASPVWSLTAVVIQLGVCVYVIFHRMVADELAISDDRGGVAETSRPSRADPST